MSKPSMPPSINDVILSALELAYPGVFERVELGPEDTLLYAETQIIRYATPSPLRGRQGTEDWDLPPGNYGLLPSRHRMKCRSRGPG